MEIRVIGGLKNLTVHVTGVLTKDIPWTPILSFEELKLSKVRIESVTFAIQEKAGLYLGWEGKNPSLILPLESRGWFDFEKVGCIQTPEGATGLAISSFGVNGQKAFLLIVDMGKQ